eukprot:955260-Amphidinium_carterae.1
MLNSSGETDAGGNKKLADVGLWLKEHVPYPRQYPRLDNSLCNECCIEVHSPRCVSCNKSLHCENSQHCVAHVCSTPWVQ